ncbi:hypoxanthine-guanine phosphoribosyltransferase [Thiolapillus brandeum]|uniref:Hypoxanthine phosphoribosyltransferase n=1 Tax=Thiolapillus brandeum TaxID=1076588 RepID=A0A7U6GI70_9GAMM|nr:hypoxanthine-guanine phosphoribosyltransferase [Thiolapillus brandeum]BAO44067.1 hypoxanthine phosphoribosyltransferase [Thiolapillus brandeum]
MSVAIDEINRVRQQARRICSRAEVEDALNHMAERITARTAGRNPLLLAVMNGGLVPLGMLLPRLDFPLRVDYLHATRYRERTFGTDLQWKKRPETSLEGETVVIVDDILDEGYTLDAIAAYCREQGAREVISVVLVHKQHDRSNGFEADIVGMTMPDQYLFGYGMDYKGYWRNAPGIFAVGEEHEH